MSRGRRSPPTVISRPISSYRSSPERLVHPLALAGDDVLPVPVPQDHQVVPGGGGGLDEPVPFRRRTKEAMRSSWRLVTTRSFFPSPSRSIVSTFRKWFWTLRKSACTGGSPFPFTR